MMTETTIEKLIAKGGKRWQKFGKDRIYFGWQAMGLELTFYGTGSIRSAVWQGEKISNTQARGIYASKCYVDVETGKVFADGNRYCEDVLTAIVAEVTAEIEAEEKAEKEEVAEVVTEENNKEQKMDEKKEMDVLEALMQDPAEVARKATAKAQAEMDGKDIYMVVRVTREGDTVKHECDGYNAWLASEVSGYYAVDVCADKDDAIQKAQDVPTFRCTQTFYGNWSAQGDGAMVCPCRILDVDDNADDGEMELTLHGVTYAVCEPIETIDPAKRMRDMDEDERREFSESFYAIWDKEIGAPRDTEDNPFPWGCPWDGGHSGLPTWSARRYFDFVKEDILQCIEDECAVMTTTAGFREVLDATTMADAMEEADGLIGGGGYDVTVTLKGESMCRRWRGCLDGMDEFDDPIQIGDGFFGDWQEED